MPQAKPHPFTDRWRCLKCGVSGISWGKDASHLVRNIRLHHGLKNFGCRYQDEFVVRTRIKPAA